MGRFPHPSQQGGLLHQEQPSPGSEGSATTRCPECGHDSSAEARFCASCGARLAERAQPRKERKFATALFADFVGSTSLAEREDPEVVQAVIGGTFDRMAAEIERHGGLVEKFMGDAVLAVFGVPSAHEDDPERAVRAALQMQGVLTEMNRRFATEGKPELAMRVGVEAGEVLVDLDRIAAASGRMLTGDAVNTAARLQTAAEPGAILVGPNVHAATRSVIDYKEVAALSLRGKAEPVPAWQPLRVRARVGGQRPSLGVEASLVGRDEEITMLQQTLQRVEMERRVALVTVLGPAGVGKSRLTWELEKHIESLPNRIFWRKGRCLAYGAVSYSALVDAVKAQCEILDDDSPEVVSAKVERAVSDLFGEPSIANEIKALVGAGGEHQFSREHLFDAWRCFLERMAARYPLVLVFEDIHWADAGLLDFIEHLVDWGQGPIFVLTLARPELLEIRTGWGGGKRNYSSLYLQPLSEAENEEMLDDLLSASLPHELKQLVIARSEGNPLYTEEIVRMFIDSGVLRRSGDAGWELATTIDQVEVPRSIHALIAARLDALPEEEKALLQDGAVVGRAFWTGATAALANGRSEQTRAVVGSLRVKEIIVPRDPSSFSGELEFAFRHVLIRDVAYESLPKSLRARKHARVAEWAQERAGDRKDELAELIATHYAEALGYLRELGETSPERRSIEAAAYQWAKRAGERARKLWQSGDAIRWFRQALELATVADAPEVELARLWEALGNAAFGCEPWQEVRIAYEKARAGYDALGRVRDTGRVEAVLAVVAFEAGNDDDVLTWGKRALGHLEPLGDSEELASALNTIGWFHWRRGRFTESEEPLRRAAEIAERVGATVIQGQALHTLGVLIEHSGDWVEGHRLVERSYEIARDAGDLDLLLRVSNNFAVLLFLSGDYERPLPILAEALELAQKSGNRLMETWVLGSYAIIAFDVGNLDEAIEYETKSYEVATALGSTVMIGMRLASLGLVTAMRGDVDEGERMHREADRILAANPEPQMEVWQYIAHALFAEARSDFDKALQVRLDGVARLGPNISVPGGERLLCDLVRDLCAAGRRDDAEVYAKHLHAMAAGRPTHETYATWADALIEQDPHRARALFVETTRRIEKIGWKTNLGRCLLDQARIESRAGISPRETLERAREVLESCGAKLFASEAEEALARL